MSHELQLEVLSPVHIGGSDGADLRSEELVFGRDTGYVVDIDSYFDDNPDEIDEFVEFVDTKITELNEYRRTEFPVGDVEVSELREKELILERRGGSSQHDNGGGSG